MSLYRNAVFAFVALAAALLAAFHAPGQMSVDTGVSLYEGMTGQAVGWGSTFYAAVLSWLGGGVVGASLMVAIECLLIYGCFAVLLTDRVDPRRVARWRIACAVVLVLNPLFAYYAGILWKDVLLATVTMAAVTLLLAASGRSGRIRYALILAALVAVSTLPLLRQQGILLAAPLALVAAWLAARTSAASGAKRLAVFVGALVLAAASNLMFSRLSDASVRPLPASPMSVGFLTIRAYDILGMVAYAQQGDPSGWSGADEATRQRINVLYSPERIDTMWHDPLIRGYINGLDTDESRLVWWSGIKHDPVAYASHRFKAMGALMGLGPIEGCVPAYWGVAAIPEHLAALSLAEEMDPRDRVIGRSSLALHDTPVFRHWFYAALLLVATAALVKRKGDDAQLVLCVAAGMAWLYLLSFGPTTIACDFRYLFPVAALATLICVYMLTHPRANAGTGIVVDRASTA